MFRQFTGQKQSNGGLNFARADCRLFVVVGESRRLGCNSLEDVVDERVQNTHGFAGYSGVWMNLFQNFVDVDSVTFLSSSTSLSFAVSTLDFSGNFCLLLLSCGFWWHLQCFSL